MSNTYISPLSVLVGANQEINYHPLSAVENASLKIDNGNGEQTHSIWEYLAFHIDNLVKLPNEVREVLLQVIDPQVSITNRLELPFRLQNGAIAVEVFAGRQRFVIYDAANVDSLLRCKAIPMDPSDPETYTLDKN